MQVDDIDYPPKMVARAGRTNAERVAAGDLRLITGGSDNLPFPDASFDKVFCNMVVYFWDAPEAHLREVRRVLKPGGHFYTGIPTRDSMRHFPFMEYGFVLHEPEEWAAMLEQHGFVSLTPERQMDPIIKSDEGDIRLESVCLPARRP